MKYLNGHKRILVDLYYQLKFNNEKKKVVRNYKELDKYSIGQQNNLREKINAVVEILKTNNAPVEFIRDLGEEIPLSEIMIYLEKNEESYSKNILENESIYTAITSEFDDEVRSCFEALQGLDGCLCNVKSEDNKIIIKIERSLAYTSYLILDSDVKIGTLQELIDDVELTKTDTGYDLRILVYSGVEDVEIIGDTYKMIDIPFSTATVKYDFFDYSDISSIFWIGLKPWQKISYSLEAIYEKYLLGEKYLNKKEQELLFLAQCPLLNDRFYIEDCKCDKEQFINYIESVSTEELVHLAKKYFECTDEKRKNRICDKFRKRLAKVDSELFYKKIYGDIVEASKQYSKKNESNKKIEEIEKLFVDKGFKGKYPYFVNENMGENVYFVQIGYVPIETKYVPMHVDSIFITIPGEQYVQENINNIDDIHFLKYKKNVHYSSFVCDIKTLLKDFEIILKIVNRAKLSKKEEQIKSDILMNDDRAFDITVFLILAGVSGLMFASIFTVAFFVMEMIWDLLEGISLAEAGMSLTEIGAMFGMTFIGFGGLFSLIISILSAKNKVI